MRIVLSLTLLCTSLVLGENSFSPLTVQPVINAGQCSADSDAQFLDQAVQSLGAMISGLELPAQPKSCMEIAENSPQAQSGYYTIEESPGNVVVKYCDMENTYISPALMQYLDGLNNNYNSLSDNVDKLNSNYESISTGLSDVTDNYNSISSALNGLSKNYSSLAVNYGEITSEIEGTELRYPLLSSCEEIQKACPTCKTGIYQVAHYDTANAYYAYCRMDNVCGSNGWTRIAYLDMTDPDHTCPSGWNTYTSGDTRACGRTASCGSCCFSTTFSSPIKYTQVCGRVYGYRYISPDGTFLFIANQGIDGVYVDGVSVTKGSPREHIWTFVAGGGNQYACPCANPPGAKSLPSFVGSNYFCEGGGGTFPNNPLWGGTGCLSYEIDCCNPPVPWFYRNITFPSTDYLELRVCADQGIGDEDVPVYLYEIYVK